MTTDTNLDPTPQASRRCTGTQMHTGSSPSRTSQRPGPAGGSRLPCTSEARPGIPRAHQRTRWPRHTASTRPVLATGFRSTRSTAEPTAEIVRLAEPGHRPASAPSSPSRIQRAGTEQAKRFASWGPHVCRPSRARTRPQSTCQSMGGTRAALTANGVDDWQVMPEFCPLFSVAASWTNVQYMGASL